jgi:hypothetical protein
LPQPTGVAVLKPSLCGTHTKKDNPRLISDYRPISISHNFSKLVSKLLANRLSSELDGLVLVNQTAFIKKCCIHDNFMYVQEVIKDLHKRKIHSLFVKLDISKAFDTVNWACLLNIMEQLGFSQRWRNWISCMWNTASSTFLVNGVPGKRSSCCRGVRQGDPLPPPLCPLLFILAMEPLSTGCSKRLFRWGFFLNYPRVVICSE